MATTEATEATEVAGPLPRSDQITVITPEVSVKARARDILRYRELLWGLVGKELKVKYKGSVLGFAWSMLNPALTLAIYYFIFQVVLGSGIPDFAVFLMCGLLVYNLFSYSTMSATAAMVTNAGIVKKVAFPREILALSSVMTGIVFFAFQAVVLVIVLIATRYHVSPDFLPLLVPAFAALVAFSSALAVFLSAVNVYFRDTQHLAEIFIGALWFWATPIVYNYNTITTKLAEHHIPTWLPLLNPITNIVLVFQRAIYGVGQSTGQHGARPGGALQGGAKGAALLPVQSGWWYLDHVLIVLGVGIVLLAIALRVFGHLEGNFAEEL